MKTILASLLLATPALAEPMLYEKGGTYATGLVVGLKAGADFSQPFNELGTSPAIELEVGWALPALERSIEIFLAAQWAAPGGEGDLEPDPRLPGDGVAQYTVDQQHVRLTLGGLYRIPLDSAIRPYVSLGLRAWLIRTTMEADAGEQDFGTYAEESTEIGAYGALGGEWHLSSGAILLEVQGGWAPFDRTIFESTAVGTLAINLGWRFFL